MSKLFTHHYRAIKFIQLNQQLGYLAQILLNIGRQFLQRHPKEFS